MYVYILLAWGVMFIVTYFKTMYGYEAFTNSPVYICIGDSILNNENYVGTNNSVIYKLSKHINILNVSTDNAKVDDVMKQISNIHSDEPNKSVILSVGGNNLLDMEDGYTVYGQYTIVVRYILKNIVSGNGKLYLVNLYYTKDKQMDIFHPVILSWNSLLETLSKDYSNIRLVDISTRLVDAKDFTHVIEPSVLGGEKIVSAILDAM